MTNFELTVQYINGESPILVFSLPYHTIPETSMYHAFVHPITGVITGHRKGVILREAAYREMSNAAYRKSVHTNHSLMYPENIDEEERARLSPHSFDMDLLVRTIFHASAEYDTDRVRLLYGGDVASFADLRELLRLGTSLPDVRFLLTTSNIEAANTLWLHHMSSEEKVVPDNMHIYVYEERFCDMYLGGWPVLSVNKTCAQNSSISDASFFPSKDAQASQVAVPGTLCLETTVTPWWMPSNYRGETT